MWQPIETAPKDGTKILAYPVFGEIATATWWRSNIHRDGGSFINGNTAVCPTHWMPLPEPPHEAETPLPDFDECKCPSKHNTVAVGWESHSKDCPVFQKGNATHECSKERD